MKPRYKAIQSETASTAVAEPPQPKPEAAPKPSGIRKITFGAIPKKKETKTQYPILPDPTGEIYGLAKLIKAQSQELEALEGSLETAKAQLKKLTLPSYFQIHTGKTEVPSSISIPTTEGEVLVTFTSRYKKLEDESPLIPLLGEEFVGQHFRQAFSISINGEKLASADPGNPERNPAQELLDELQAMIARHNAAEAVAYRQEIKPTREFHEKRHCLLTPEQNVQVDAVCSMIVQVKTKGRDGED
ncbi:MAG: hypothetical protein HY735_12885 [Verrucomicrobia bacterium]|nr:hypothetical protein [Verrucomicrobiota bacterium]